MTFSDSFNCWLNNMAIHISQDIKHMHMPRPSCHSCLYCTNAYIARTYFSKASYCGKETQLPANSIPLNGKNCLTLFRVSGCLETSTLVCTICICSYITSYYELLLKDKYTATYVQFTNTDYYGVRTMRPYTKIKFSCVQLLKILMYS